RSQQRDPKPGLARCEREWRSVAAAVVRGHRGIQRRVSLRPAVGGRIHRTGGNTGASEEPRPLRRLRWIWRATALNNQSACRENDRQRTGTHHRSDSHNAILSFRNVDALLFDRFAESVPKLAQKI